MTKHLEASIQPLVDEFIANQKPCPSKLTVAERRAGYIASTVVAGESPQIAQEFLEQLDGITVKVYKPSHETNLPVTVYFHGGCFISGGFATHDVQMRQLAKLANSVVICIQYRLAPEHTYPAAHDDVYQAVLAIKQHAQRLGGNSEHIVFAGDSAGGQLALATTIRLKQAQLWLPKEQILIYPMLDPLGNSASYLANGTDYLITAEMLLSGFRMYAGDTARLKQEPELNLLKADFNDLPRTTIITAEFDPLLDEGELLYKRMREQGVDAYCERYLGVIHGFFQLGGISRSAQRCMQHIANLVQSA
ncbi:alpha/beta hydrolase [Vibrio taketomensis]|uniref:alpha/beta hydrolase n=1 Tax=Vibrio taketomensis TaxID=2572923 RepID=UPI00138A463E|nr:alpha/beta hydrolase [Vibrio taketomensis]